MEPLVCTPWLWESPTGAYVVTGADCRHTPSGGVGQEARVGAKCGCTGNCGVPGCQCALLWPQSLAMGVHMTVEFGDRSRVGVCKYTAEGASPSLCTVMGSASGVQAAVLPSCSCRVWGRCCCRSQALAAREGKVWRGGPDTWSV